SGASTIGFGGRQFNFTFTDTAIRIHTGTPTPPINAYWTGSHDSSWSTINSFHTNWSTNTAGTADAGALPGPTTGGGYSNVFFTADNAVSNFDTTLDGDFTINSLTLRGTGAAAANSITISSGGLGTNNLTLMAAGGAGITVESGSGTHSISTNIIL